MKKSSQIFRNAIMLNLMILMIASSSFAQLQSRNTQGEFWWGNVEITNYTRRITVHPYFLDIEEDIELAPYGWRKPQNNLNTLEIVGSFNLPTQSVITGILIWDGDNLLQGKLKGKQIARAEYEEVVDRETAPPPRPRDPILIEKMSVSGEVDRYNCSIYPVEWGKSRRIRIRYLCPQRYINGELMLQVPQSLATEADKYPSKITQKISAYGDIERLKMISHLDTTIYSLPANLNDDYNIAKLRNTYIKIPESENSLMVKTSFGKGNWQGNYAMYWGTPPDSLLIKAGLRREIVFLWKWNFWHTFVYNDDSTKSVSPYGTEAINQARQIYNSNNAITQSGDKVGLLLEKGTPEQNKMFALCKKNTETYDSLQSFLASIDSSYLLSTISGASPPIQVRIPENERENFFSRSTQSFDISLKLICNLFSEHEKVLKHIVFISAGPVPEMPNLENFYEGTDHILSDKITISAYGSSPRYPTGYWPGVPMYRIVEKHALLDDGEFTNSFWIPNKKDAQFSVTMRNAKKSYTHELTQLVPRYKYDYYTYDTLPADTFTFFGHSTTPWSDAVEWKAYNTDDDILATHSYIPPTLSVLSDTFCVKLWAGANAPVSDTSFLTNRGPRYGIVDEQYSLLALEQDVVSQPEKELLENQGVPFLSDDEIFLSKPLDENDPSSISTKISKVNSSQYAFLRIGKGSFKLLVPKNEKVKSIRIFDLRGRLVFILHGNRINYGNIITFQNNGRLSRGIYTVVVETNVKRHVEGFQIL